MINMYEVSETNKMIESENLDVRTITLGISLLDCVDSDLNELNRKIYEKITTVAKDLVSTGKDIEKEFGTIAVLVNNAGLALGTAPAQSSSLDEWDTMIDTNTKGLVTVTRTVLPEMLTRNSGVIINIGSMAGNTPYPGGNVYGATKAFVEQFTRNLRAELVGTGVRATNLAPGLVGGTEFSNVRYRGDDAAAAKVYEGTVPLTAADIAETAYWIATQPPHVNIIQLEVVPTCQGYAGWNIKRNVPAPGQVK